MIDSHMHINSKVLDDKNKYIDKINNNRLIESVINVGLDIETSKESIKISNENFKFYSTLGIHPLYINNQNLDELYKLYDNEKVVAIGEVGLDYLNKDYYLQLKYLKRQIFIANELKLPVIIHANNTNEEIVNIFQNYIKPNYGCVFHCFKPDLYILNYLMDNGYYISFASKITKKNAKKSIEVLKKVSNNLYLIETDSPYMQFDFINSKINESSNIKYVIEKIAYVKNVSFEKIDKITTENTKRLFKKVI